MDSLSPELKKWKFKPGQIIRIKKGSRVWLICLQSNIIFDEEETYIQLTSIAYDKSVAFGYKVEKNMFGPLKWDNEHDEIMVACESLDLSETYAEKNFVMTDFFGWIMLILEKIIKRQEQNIHQIECLSFVVPN